MGWIDCHCHLADQRIFEQAPQIIEDAKSRGIDFFLQGGVDPEDWTRQQELQKQFPENIGLCFGLHPYWVAKQEDEDACDVGLDMLARQLKKAMAIGELGLDFRPNIMKESKALQITVFEQQLELAEAADLPMVLHLVQAHEEALRVLDVWGVPPRGGMVHSFNNSLAKAEDFMRRGLMISVGGPLVNPENERLRQAVRGIPMEFFTFRDGFSGSTPSFFERKLE